MLKYDFTNYLTKWVIGFAAYSAYDVFIDKRDFGGYASSDAFSYAIGLIAAEWAADLLSNMIDVNGSSVSGMLTKPLLTGLVYMYLIRFKLFMCCIFVWFHLICICCFMLCIFHWFGLLCII